jgi:stress response protein YsnF
LTEKSEQAVINKSARVVEEVVVGKDVTQQSQTVSDTVSPH